jgi:hypothetical protein
MNPTKTKIRITILFIIIIALVIVTYFFAQSRFNIFPQLVSTLSTPQRPTFPDTSTDLDPIQDKIITLLKQEYASNPPGSKYSQGSNEAWCANFVSWIYKESGVPLENPHSGSWRIPGTYTLREYYQAIGKFHTIDSGYIPKIGDIMLYDNPSSFGQHTNMIIAIDNGKVTTIGGNEPGGIRIVENRDPNQAGFIGFGEL